MSKYLYQPGDAVRVRSDLSVDTVYAMKSGDDTVPHWLAVDDMLSFAGKVVHIEKMLGDVYTVKEVKDFIWVDEMFEDTLDECVCFSLL